MLGRFGEFFGIKTEGTKTTRRILKLQETPEIRFFKTQNPLEINNDKVVQTFIRNTGLDENRWRSYWLVSMNPDGLTEHQIEAQYGKVEFFEEFGGIVIDEMYSVILQIQDVELRNKIALLYQQYRDCIREEVVIANGLDIDYLATLGFFITRKN